MQKINEQLVNAIQVAVNYPSILRIGVFGSHARGENKHGSDVDILYDYDDTLIDDMLSCIEEIDNRIDSKIDFISFYSLLEGEKDEYDIAFRDSVLKDVVWIYEKE